MKEEIVQLVNYTISAMSQTRYWAYSILMDKIINNDEIVFGELEGLLVKVLKTPANNKVYPVMLLGEIKAVDSLIKLLQNDDVKAVAALTLEKLNDEHARKALDYYNKV